MALSAWHNLVLVNSPLRLLLTLHLALGLTLTLVCSISHKMNLNVLISEKNVGLSAEFEMQILKSMNYFNTLRLTF